MESPRIQLRPPIGRDVQRFVRWFNDPEIISNLNIHLPISEIAEREWLRTMSTTRSKTDVVLVIEIRGGHPIPIGNVGLHKIDHINANAEISIVLGEKQYWGKGFASEATRLMLKYGFDELNLHRVYTGVFAFNQRSISTITGLGFIQEGVQRQAVYTKGTYHDVIHFGLLREEFFIQTGNKH